MTENIINYNEQQYLNLLSKLINKAETQPIRKDRTSVGTYSLFGKTLEFDLSDNKIPLFTTKKTPYNKVLQELFWMFRLGNPDTSYLDENNNKIWKSWTVYNDKHPKGTIGPMYGQIIRKGDVDQFQEAIDLLKRSPTSRRALFSSWSAIHAADERLSFEENVAQNRGTLNACHGLMNQLYINDQNELEMFTYQRSCDFFIGFNWNAPFYGTLAHMIARELGIKASKLVYGLGDVHLYSNHLEQAKLQLSRQPYSCPTIVIDKDINKFDDWSKIEQIKTINYQHHPFIKAPVAI